MKFRISGTEHTTSARRVVEVEANNRAAAEKAAHAQGIDVQHVEQIPENPLDPALATEPARPQSHRGEFEDAAPKTWKLLLAAIIVLAAVAAAIYWWRTRAPEEPAPADPAGLTLVQSHWA